MRIFLFGVSQVGKSTVAKILAEKLNYKFFDIDMIVIQEYGSLENFQNIYSNRERRFQKKSNIVLKYKDIFDDFVMAVSPIYSYEVMEELYDEISDDFCFTLVASPLTIFERLGFYDEKGHYMEDSEDYKKEHKEAILKSILNDNFSNNYEFSFYDSIITDNKTAEEVADYIIEIIKNI